jgi:hypothetical protein
MLTRIFRTIWPATRRSVQGRRTSRALGAPAGCRAPTSSRERRGIHRAIDLAAGKTWILAGVNVGRTIALCNGATLTGSFGIVDPAGSQAAGVYLKSGVAGSQPAGLDSGYPSLLG